MSVSTGAARRRRGTEVVGSGAGSGRNNLAGILLMVAAMALVPMIDVLAKYLVTDGIPALQVVYLRMLCGTIILFPFMLSARRREIVPPQGWTRALLLGVFGIASGVCFFGALRYLSIADTLALSFVQPLFVTILSRLFLAERVSPLRWLALFVGFGATLLIIRPGMGAINTGTILALCSGASMACYVILVKHGTSGRTRVSALTLTYQSHSMAFLVATPLMFWLWQDLTHPQWVMAVCLTAIGLVGQYLIIKAYDFGETSLIAPLAYTEIITSTAASWQFFGQTPDNITLIGVAILVCSSVLLARNSGAKV